MHGPLAVMYPFLSGGGEAAEIIRKFDWAATPLGHIETWPSSLKSTIALILRSNVPIATLWGDDGIMIYNDAYSIFAGGRHPQLFGSKVREGWPEVAEFNDNVMKVGLAGRTLSYREFPLTLYRNNGSPEAVWLNLDYSPLLGDDGSPAGVMAVVVEITDKVRIEHGQAATAIDNARLYQSAEREIVRRRKAEEALQSLNNTLEKRVLEEVYARTKVEEQLRRVQKMEAVGQLTGGIAHDFNNMLAVILGALNLLQRKLKRGETDVERFVDGALDGARRAAALTQRLLAFSRQQPLSPEPLVVNRLVASMSELLGRTLGEQVIIETLLGAGLWQIRVDPAQLENALLNLAVNARDAMSSGGKLTIETLNVSLDDAYARNSAMEPGHYVLIAVTDTGAGMTQDVMAKAFDPFFTTKGAGRGTGLGLSQVYGFVRQSGGHVKIYSELGVGTSVKIYFPRFCGPSEVPLPMQSSSEIHRGTQREVVLVVEDEDRVRALSGEALKELGYTVIEAAGPAEALRILETGRQITLLFTDVVMPEMSGRQLADLALKRWPGLKVLYTTGYPRNAVTHNGLLESGTNVLTKPFNFEELALKIRKVLDAGD